MASYTHDYSLFPAQILTRRRFRDVDDMNAPVINQLKTLQAEGRYSEAAAYIREHQNDIGSYVLGSDYMNTIDEETRNIEIYAMAKKQQIYYQDTEPDTEPSVNDVWLSPK